MASPEANIKVTADIQQAERELEKLMKQGDELQKKIGAVEVPLRVLGIEEALKAVGGLGGAMAVLQRRTHRVQLNDSQIQAAIVRTKTLDRELTQLTPKKHVINVEYVETRKGSGGKPITPAEIARRAQEARSGGLSAQAAAIIGGQRKAEDASTIRSNLLGRIAKGSLSRGGYNEAGLKRIIQDLGGIPQGKVADLRKQAEQLINTVNDSILNEIGQNLFDLRMQFRPLRSGGRMKARSTPNFNDLLDSIAQTTNRPEVASGMLRRLPERYITTDLAEAANKQRRYYDAVPMARGIQDQIRGLDPLLKTIAETFAKYFRSTVITNPWIGPTGNRLNEILQQRPAASSPLALPAAGQSSYGRMTRSAMSGLPAITAPRFGAVEDERYIRSMNRYLKIANDALNGIAEDYTTIAAEVTRQKSVARQVSEAMIQSRQRLLPPAGGTGGGRGGALATIPETVPYQGYGRGLNAITDWRERRDVRNRIRRAEIQRRREGAQNMSERVQNSLVSGAFPLLFGAGPLATAGGFLGGALGASNPMIGVFTSAIGQLIDQFGAAAIEMGQALRDPITNFQKLADAGLLAGKAQEFTISKLIELGRVSEATAIIQGELIKKIGVSGVNDMQAAGAAATELSKAWAEMTLQMQAAVSGPLASLLKWLADVIAIGNGVSREASRQEDILNGLSKSDQKALKEQEQKILSGATIFNEAEKRKQVSALYSSYASRSTPPAIKGTVTDPNTEVKAAEARLATAERAEALRRQGIQLERQQQDFELSVADQVYGFRRRAADLERASIDLRRSIEDEIFRKRQEIARIEIDNERQRKQIAIERTDLALAGGRVSGNRPGQDLANGLLDALRQYVRGRAEAEADLQQKERTFQVEMVELRRASERYRFEVERKVADLQRQAADYNRDVEKAKLTAERTIYDLQIAAADYRIAKAKEAIQLETQAAAQVSATNALTGQISGSAAGGKVVQHLHGDPGRAGYDPAGHGGQANAHDHFAFDSEATTRKVMEGLKKLGYVITEFGVKSGHSNGSLHYSNRAFDVPWSQFGSGPIGQNDYNRSRQLQRDVQKILGQSGGTQMSPVFQRPGAAANNIVPTATPRSVDTSGAMAALNGLAAPGVGSVSSLMSSLEQLDAKLIKTRELSLSLAKEFAAMTDLQRAKTWGDTVQAAIDGLNKPLDDILQKQGDQAAYQREYAELLNKGVLPDLAKQILEIRDQVKVQLQQLDTAISVLEASKLKLEAEGKWTEELQKQLDLLKAQKGVIEGKGQQAESGAKQAQSPGQRLNDAYAKVKGELNELTDPVNQIVAGANAIGSAFGEAFKNIASGAMTAQEAMAQMFQSIANHFLDMAAQMIAKYIEMQMIGLAQGLLSGALGGAAGGGAWGGSGGSAWGGFAGALQMPSLMATGGFVTGPTRALIGEGGANEYVIPENKMHSAMSRYAMGARGAAVVDGAGTTPDGGAAAPVFNWTFETTSIGGQEFVSRAQLEQAMAQTRAAAAQEGAKMGEARAMKTLQNSRSQRGRLGL